MWSLVNTAKFFWPIGDRVNRVPLYYYEKGDDKTGNTDSNTTWAIISSFFTL